jgi:hypothetical protein
MVNQKYYLEDMTKFREWVRKERPKLWKKESSILHPDNAQTLIAPTVKQFLADKFIPVLKNLFTEFSPLWLYLFLKVKCV